LKTIKKCRFRLKTIKTSLREIGSSQGLPDGSFSNPKSRFGWFWRVLQWNILVYCTTISPILRLFGILSPFWSIVPRKIWQPWSQFFYAL
jgi:hypothetical protein